jgi:hypothetical protein
VYIPLEFRFKAMLDILDEAARRVENPSITGQPAVTQDADDRTIHATLQRNHLFAADRKCVEVGESSGVA